MIYIILIMSRRKLNTLSLVPSELPVRENTPWTEYAILQSDGLHAKWGWRVVPYRDEWYIPQAAKINSAINQFNTIVDLYNKDIDRGVWGDYGSIHLPNQYTSGETMAQPVKWLNDAISSIKNGFNQIREGYSVYLSEEKAKAEAQRQKERVEAEVKRHKEESQRQVLEKAKEENYKINELERQLKEEKDKNQKLIVENKNLKEKINTLNKEIEQIEGLKDKINKLNKELNEIKELNIKMEKDLSQKNIEIQKLSSQQNKDYYDISSLKPDDKIITVNFVSMGSDDIGHYSLICKKRDLFVRIEERLFEDFPQFKNHETYFETNGKRIKRYQTIEQNKIKTNDIINIFIVEE